MRINYQRNFSKLPLKGQLKQIPWNGSYWPTYQGGVSYRWNTEVKEDISGKNHRFHYPILKEDEIDQVDLNSLSPTEKYDLLMGQTTFPLTRYEKKRTNINSTNPDSPNFRPDYEIPLWEGLCHAWAIASLEFLEPGPIIYTSRNNRKIPFAASDIKALLTFFIHLEQQKSYLSTRYLGSRCFIDFHIYKEKFENGEITEEEYQNAINSRSCEDINAGAFHVALTNQIGILNEGIIADIYRESEVWNHPIYWYESRVVGERKLAANSEGVVKEIEVITKIKHAFFTDPSWYPYVTHNQSPLLEELYGKKKYHYILEVDSLNKIIGGKWISQNYPDFVWKQRPPVFKGHFTMLGEIYNKSLENLKNLKNFWQAIASSDLLLETIDVNIQDERGDTGLIHAVRNNSPDVVLVLLEHGANLNLQNLIGVSPLHLAVKKDLLDITKILIKYNPQLDIQNQSGQTPLHLACLQKNFELIDLLLKQGSPIDAQNFNGRSVLHQAVALADLTLVKYLIEKNANLELGDHGNKTPFFLAIQKNYFHIAHFLAEQGAHIETKSNQEMAPIHIATTKGSAGLIELILQYGADINLQEGSGKTSLHIAVEKKNKEIIKLLLHHKADKTVKDLDNLPPLDYAKQDTEIAQLLKEDL
jgi:ankyrin repeat protein